MAHNAQIDRPWAVFRSGIPNICVARYRKRTDADGYLNLMRSQGQENFFIAYDIPQVLKEAVQQ